MAERGLVEGMDLSWLCRLTRMETPAHGTPERDRSVWNLDTHSCGNARSGRLDFKALDVASETTACADLAVS